MGGIKDSRGLEQGGCGSDWLHKLTNNEQLKVAQAARVGVDLGISFSGEKLLGQNLGAVGLADDVGLLSNSVLDLKLLLHLSQEYCSKFHVNLVAEKTKLLIFLPKSSMKKAQGREFSHECFWTFSTLPMI